MSDPPAQRGGHAPGRVAEARRALVAWVDEAGAAGRVFLQLRLLALRGQVTEGDRAEVLGLVLGQHQPQVIDAGARRHDQIGRLNDRLGHLVVDVAAEHERQRLAHRSTFPVHVEPGQILRIEPQLHLAERQRVIHRVAIARQRDGGRARDSPTHGPAEGFAEQG